MDQEKIIKIEAVEWKPQMLEEVINKYSQKNYLKKLLSYPFGSIEEINECFSPFLSVEDLETVASSLPISTRHLKRLEVPFCISKPKLYDTKEPYRVENTVIYEEDLVESDIEYEPSQDIVCEEVNLFRKGKKILEDAEFKLVKNCVYGLIGKNGVGKSTFLEAVRKRLLKMPRVKIHMVGQEHFMCDKSVIDYVAPVNKREANGVENLQEELDHEDILKRKDAYKVLRGFGFSDPDVLIKDLSGGWSCRVRLAKAVLSSPDLLLLDEPTNMLDLESIIYLQKQIKMMKTVLVVSHDRHFLNNVSDYILEIDEGKLTTYRGNYDKYLLSRDINDQMKEREYKRIMNERQNLTKFIDRFRYNAKRAGLVQSKIKVLEKLRLPEIKKRRKVVFKFDAGGASPVVLEIKNMCYRKVLSSIDLKVNEGDRIAIVGPNGAGKTTLLKCIADKLEFGGDIIRCGSIGYFAQAHVENLPFNMTVRQHWLRATENESLEDFKRSLGQFGLNLDEQQIRFLSGGEKSRLCFSLISYFKPTLLVLDEPTNHLDMDSIESLTCAISEFRGAVIVVSHDMQFIERCFNKIYVCKDGKLTYFKGTIREYHEEILKTL